MKTNPEKLKAWKARSKGLKAKTGLKPPATGHRKPVDGVTSENQRFYRGHTCSECNALITIKNRSGRCRKHKIQPLEVRQKIAAGRIAENNPNWKGNKVKYGGLHLWVKSRLSKPDVCEICHSAPPCDLANKGTYDRNLSNWEWLCRKCHMQSDGRLNNLKQFRKTTKASKLRRKKGEWSTQTADTYFSRYIRERDGSCQKCGTLEGLTCSHYHGRGKSATRFDPINCIALCWTCHQEWEGPKSDYTTFMIDRIGVDAFLALTLRAGEYKERKEAVADCKRFLASL